MAARQGFERKHVFIDRRLQGRYMLTFLVPMLLMLGFMLFTLGFASQSIVKSAMRIMKEDVDSQVAVALQDRAEPGVEVYKGLIEDLRDYVRSFATNTRYRRVLMSSLLWTFGLGVFILILQIVWLTIYFSHKVAGPIYRLEKVCRGLIEGDYRQDVYLRKGDELQNLATLLGQVVERTRERLIGLRDAPDEAARREVASSIEL
jgi:nitrogen fixation/metabolism regulation signal transduction histidine kinase